MRNEKNIVYIIRDKRAITNLSLTCKISTSANLSFIKGSKKTQKNEVLL